MENSVLTGKRRVWVGRLKRALHQRLTNCTRRSLMEECNHTRRSLCHQTGNRGKVWLKKNKTKQVELDERKKEGEISYTGLEAAIGSIQEICLAKPVEESTITTIRKLPNMSNEETCKGHVQGLYTRECVEKLKTQCLCLYPSTVTIQKHGWKHTAPQSAHLFRRWGGREQEELEHTGVN